MVWVLLGVFCVLAVALLACGFLGAFSNRPVTVQYTMTAPKLAHPLRLALVTDLHSSPYGAGQKELLELLAQSRPDLVLLGGDLVDDRYPEAPAWAFLEAVAARYSCCYVTGNHEQKRPDPDRVRRRIKDLGIQVLAGETISLAEGVTLSGVDDSYPAAGADEAQLAACSRQVRPSDYNILLVHRPEVWNRPEAAAFSLTLAGHTHGGQWRIPGLLNGTFATGQGLFPKLAGGLYTDGDRKLIVSRGLGKIATRIPRLFCPLELVLVELIPEVESPAP